MAKDSPAVPNVTDHPGECCGHTEFWREACLRAWARMLGVEATEVADRLAGG